MKRNKRIFVGLLLSAIAMVAFGSTFFIYSREKQQDDTQTLTIVTSFYPMYLAALNLTEGVAGIELHNLSEPDTGCLHDYQLTPEDMRLLATADAFIVNGGGIETFLSEVGESYPSLHLIDASEGLELLDDNAHIWMSLSGHKEQIKNIAAGLAKADPAHAKEYANNAKDYLTRLELLDEREQKLQKETAGRPVILFHEAYAYLATDLGMPVNFVMDLDEERQVSAGEVADVLRVAEEQEGILILAEETYGREMGELVEEKSRAKCVYLNPLVRGRYDKDGYIRGMMANYDLLEQVLTVREEEP